MVLAQEDKTGVGGQGKRLFPEAIKVEVHQKLPLDTFTSSNNRGKNTETTEFFFDQAYRSGVIAPHNRNYS
jgi:hypothetical protein